MTTDERDAALRELPIATVLSYRYLVGVWTIAGRPGLWARLRMVGLSTAGSVPVDHVVARLGRQVALFQRLVHLEALISDAVMGVPDAARLAPALARATA